MVILFILIAANAICIISALVWQSRKAGESIHPLRGGTGAGAEKPRLICM